MDFFYASAFGVAPPDAYEQLLLDAMLGDATLSWSPPTSG